MTTFINIKKTKKLLAFILFLILLGLIFFLFKKTPVNDQIIEESFLTDEDSETDVVNIKLFWGKEGEDGIFEVLRIIPQTPTIEKVAVEELLKGPGINNKANGYYTAINDNVALLSLKIENGIAFVDFDSKLEKDVAGSAKVLFIREQIEKTLKQFSEIDDVVISIEGQTEDILQP